MPKVILNNSQIALLKEIHQNTLEKRIADRVKTILCLDKGFTYEEVEEILLIRSRSIRRYEDLFLTAGIEGLVELDYKGGMTKLSAEQEKELKEHLENHLYGYAKEIVEYIHKTYGIKFTPDGMVITLHRLGFSYKKTKRLPAKADKEKQVVFIKSYQEVRNNIDVEKETIYFIDGVHPTHNIMPANGWIKKGTDKYIKSNTGRKRVNINGAYCPIDRSVVVREDERINSESTIKLFKQLEAKHLDLETIHAYTDNARYYYSKLVWDYLKTSRIKIHYLPSYSPNLNLIERLWRLLKKEILYNEYYEKFDQFKQAVMGFFENIKDYDSELVSLMTEKFKLLDVSMAF